MKKLFYILAAAAALAMFTGCDPDNKDDEKISSLIPKSYEEVFLMNGDVHFKYVHTPTWSGDRLASEKYEYYESKIEFDGEKDVYKGLFLSAEGTTTYTWGDYSAEGNYTGRQFDRMSQEWSDISPTTYQLKFDNSWRATKYSWSTESYSTSTDYTYEGDYVVKSNERDYITNYIWKDGDLTSCYTETGNVRHYVGYTSEANPFKDGLDPTLRHIFDDPYTYGFLGKHAAHLPSKLLVVSGTGDFENQELMLYSYTKDSQGRITEMKIERADPVTEEVFPDQMHTQYIKFNY